MDASISETIAVTILTLVLWLGDGSLNQMIKPILCGGGSGHERGFSVFQTLCGGGSGHERGRKASGYQIVKPYLGFTKIENNRVEEIEV